MIQQHLDKIREIVNTDIDPALWEICQGILREVRAIEAIIAPKVPTPTPKCPNKFRPDGTYSGCQLHNLHCAYPNCEK